ncbi:MAG TPA: DUF1326 domain-containing protein [Terriglobia bacterium]|nr:DUF1326 domain-containing protein [Terriglobia bacterium]
MTRHTVRAIILVFLSIVVGQAATTSQQDKTRWELKGNLSEACSCRVPCTCNFRSGPSPHHFCWAMFSLDIQKGRYGKVKLNGLHLAAAHADKAVVWYIDERATPKQFAALKAIAVSLHYYHSELPAFYKAARITQVVTDKGNDVEIEGHGGFKADYVTGGDGKTPIVVENITAWNLPRSIKGRTEYLRYTDSQGNKLDFKNTNSNEGKFDWTDKRAL